MMAKFCSKNVRNLFNEKFLARYQRTHRAVVQSFSLYSDYVKRGIIYYWHFIWSTFDKEFFAHENYVIWFLDISM